jgi:hypothetical protein
MIIDDPYQIVESIESIVTSMQQSGVPNFMYDNRVGLNKRLIEEGKITAKKNFRYPLIALKTPFDEHVKNGRVHVQLNIIIVQETEKEYTTPERREQVFKPILYPLYKKFLETLTQSGLFYWEHSVDGELPEHIKVDRYYWGTHSTNGNVANILSDPLDAIEIFDLKLSKDINC